MTIRASRSTRDDATPPSNPERPDAPPEALALRTGRAKPATDPASRAARRGAILSAALDLFARQGYGETRLEDVARAAGVAKGTLYLYFPNKQALFEGIVTHAISPALADAAALLPHFTGSTRDLLDLLVDLMTTRILERPERAILLLMITEGARFPDLAAFHHRTVVVPGLDLLRAVMARGQARGEVRSDVALRFPQMMFASAVTALVWQNLFSAIDPLDVRAFVAAHTQALLRGLEGDGP